MTTALSLKELREIAAQASLTVTVRTTKTGRWFRFYLPGPVAPGRFIGTAKSAQQAHGWLIGFSIAQGLYKVTPTPSPACTCQRSV